MVAGTIERVGRALLALSLASIPAASQEPGAGEVWSQRKISATAGHFTGELDKFDGFGGAVCSLGDLDGDGVDELAVGAIYDDDGGGDRGAVWILSLRRDGSVGWHQKISSTSGGFLGALDDDDRFGVAVATLGDLDGDGVTELAVGAYLDDDGGDGMYANYGAVWVLFLEVQTSGEQPLVSVRSHQKISATEGGFTGELETFDLFGHALAALGDLDGDGVADLAVGAHRDDDGEEDHGAVWILFLRPDGSVREHAKISSLSGGFTGELNVLDWFGFSLSALGDLDGDGVGELAVAARYDDDGGEDRGAVWVLFLELTPEAGRTLIQVRSHTKISATSGDFAGALDDFDHFGSAVLGSGDFDGDGTPDLFVGAPSDDGGGILRGAVWALFLGVDGKVDAYQKIDDTTGGFGGVLFNGDFFGSALALLNDLDGDGARDLAVGAPGTNDLDLLVGALWVTFLYGDGAPAVASYGCEVNPADSLVVLDGRPSLGTTLVLGVDNPLATQAVGSLPFVLFSSEPDAAYPCGSLLPGFGMAGSDSLGELLVAPERSVRFLQGPAWGGMGSPSPISLQLTPNPYLVGRTLYCQGLLIDPTPSSANTFGLTNALELRLGP